LTEAGISNTRTRTYFAQRVTPQPRDSQQAAPP
jgi:hypothetical protein